MHSNSIISVFAALFLGSGYARGITPRDQDSPLPQITVTNTSDITTMTNATDIIMTSASDITMTNASDITIMPNGNPYLNISLTNTTSSPDPTLSKRGSTLKITYSNGVFSGSSGDCKGNPARFTYFNDYVGSAICISAPGTNCMLQADPRNTFWVCNKPGCSSESSTRCTSSNDLQIGESSYYWQSSGYDYLYATKGTNSIYFDPN